MKTTWYYNLFDHQLLSTPDILIQSRDHTVQFFFFFNVYVRYYCTPINDCHNASALILCSPFTNGSLL